MDNLVQDIFKLNQELTASIKRLAENGKILANAEKDYKITLRKEVLNLRAEKMAVTLIDLIIYGVPEVAELRLKRDIAKTIYETNQEHINITKLKLRLLEAQVSREWGSK
jgi:hypothetical protein